MERKRNGLVPFGEALGDLDGPVKAIRKASAAARRGFTLADQVNQLVGASEADPDRGFMARMMVLCSLPRTNPGNRKEYKRANGPYTLYMNAVGGNKLPYGNLPRLLLAWVCTEVVRTRSRELILGRSLSEFMRTLDILSSDSGGASGVRTRLRNQMKRLFSATVQLIYEDQHGEVRVSSFIANRTEFWWTARKPNEPSLWESKIELSEKFFNEIIRHPVPIDINTLTALKRCALGLDLYLWLVYRTFPLRTPQRITWRQVIPSVWLAPLQSQRQAHRPRLPTQGSTRVEEDQGGLARPELLDGSWSPNPAPLDPGHRAAQSRPVKQLISPFPASQLPPAAFRAGLGL